MSSKYLLGAALLACSMLVKANIAIQGSRVIYDQARSEVDIQLQQVGHTPGLIQIWLDEGDEQASVETLNLPFLLAPAIARMDPGGRQLVRIVRSRNDLPCDRESLLWLNVQETPLSSTGPQPGVRTRIKFFYRPGGLSSSPENAHQALQFSLVPASADDRVQLRVYNPTPYHITFRELALQDALNLAAPALAEFSTDAPGERMVAPMSELILTLERHTAPSMPLPADASVAFSIITDYGGMSAGQRAVQRQPPVHLGVAAQ